MSEPKPHHRVNEILLGPLERPALHWLAAHMPPWVTPDRLTLVGFLGAAVVCAGYWLSGVAPAFLWLASLGVVVNWFGDSLDGTLARYRRIERPRYGYFVDHTVDAFNEFLIVIGLGLSPYMRFDVACLALVGYLLMSVLVFVRTYVEGVFQISYGKFGPTEVRVLLLLLTATMYFAGPLPLDAPWRPLSAYDVLVGGIAAVLIVLYVTAVIRQARTLARLEG